MKGKTMSGSLSTVTIRSALIGDTHSPIWEMDLTPMPTREMVLRLLSDPHAIPAAKHSYDEKFLRFFFSKCTDGELVGIYLRAFAYWHDQTAGGERFCEACESIALRILVEDRVKAAPVQQQWELLSALLQRKHSQADVIWHLAQGLLEHMTWPDTLKQTKLFFVGNDMEGGEELAIAALREQLTLVKCELDKL